MDKDFKLIRGLTASFIEVKPILIEHKKIHKKLRSLERKLKTFETNYDFISNIIAVGANSDFLSFNIKRLFKSAGFEKVVHFKSPKHKPKREDLQLWSEDEIFIV